MNSKHGHQIQIDDRALVPLGWVLSGFMVIVGFVVVGSFWVASVNFRLQRIEQKLGIPSYQSAENSNGILNSVSASEGDGRK